MSRYFGEVPYYIGAKGVSRFINRNLQLSLPFPPSNVVPFPSLAAIKAANERALLLARQPRRYPPGYHAWSLVDPEWRVRYALRWIERRKAAGLPHAITDPLYLAALAKYNSQEKTA